MNSLKTILSIATLLFSLSLFGGTGAELFNEFTDNDEFYEDQEWQDYVQALGERLLKYTNEGDQQYYFFVLDNPTINAFATPDAYIYINRGLITYLSSEAQLAAVIGHEIGHVALRHAAKQRRAALLGTSVGLAAYALTGRGEMLEASDAWTNMVVSGYGRDDELEADEYGADVIAKAGYNPLEVINTVHVLKDQDIFARDVRKQTPRYHALNDTHPKNDKRLHSVVNYALDKLPDRVTEDVGDFWELMDGLHYGVPTDKGLVEKNIYYDKQIRLVYEYPPTWNVSYELRGSRVIGTPPGGRDVATIEVTRIVPEGDLTVSTFIREILPPMELEGDLQEIKTDCCTYHIVNRVIADARITSSVLVIYKRGYDYFVIRGEAGSKGNEASLKTAMEKVVEGIRTIKPEDLAKENIQKIEVIIAEPSDTYAKLAKETSLVEYPEEMLRLINGQHPYGEPRAGDYIKIIK